MSIRRCFFVFLFFNEKKSGNTMTVKEIKEFMRINKITQVELSEKSGLPLQTIRNIFSNPTRNPRIDTMQAIENALGFVSPTARNTPKRKTTLCAFTGRYRTNS